MTEALLAFNAGSSSLKFALFCVEDGRLAPRLRGQFENLGNGARFRVHDRARALVVDQWLDDRSADDPHAAALARLLAWIDEHDDGFDLLAAGHRVVHGGEHLTSPRRVDAALIEQMGSLAALAPLHQRHGIAPIQALHRMRPDLVQVACFDTAFHATLPAAERTYALGADLRATGVRRYGFHGLSYEYVAACLPEIAGAEVAHGRVIVAHLGNGASMCAMRGMRSIATTMGFTALDGLVMGTRSGALDPGAVLHLLRHEGYDAAMLEHKLYHESGLLGLSGLSHDMRTLLADGSPASRLALDVYCHRIVREAGALAAAMGGLDAIVFTAGVGENAAPVRARVLDALGWLGIELDPEANIRHGPRLHRSCARVQAWVVPTNEEAVVAMHALHLVRADARIALPLPPDLRRAESP